MYINTFKYTPADVDCKLCTEYVKKFGCTACGCPWMAERIEAGVVGYAEVVRQMFPHDIAATGRVRGEDDVIAYHLRQSFVPGEITPEEANRLGCELARRFTKGKHAFIVCTHIDRKHTHNVRPDRAMRKAV